MSPYALLNLSAETMRRVAQPPHVPSVVESRSRRDKAARGWILLGDAVAVLSFAAIVAMSAVMYC